MHLHAFRELRQEQVLIYVVHTEFLQDRSQVSLVNKLLSIAFLLEQANGVDHGAEHRLILQKLGADSGKSFTAGHVESGSNTFQVMQPGVEVDQRLFLLIEAEVVGEAANHVRSHICGPDLLKPITELLFDDGLGEAGVVAHHIDLLLLVGDLFAFFLGTLQHTSLAFRFLQAIRVVFSEDDSKVDSFVNQSSLDELQRLINLVDLAALMFCEQLAHEKDEVQVLRLALWGTFLI